MDYNKKQPIVEVYPCLQSEGKLVGIPHFLIRTTGCVLRCQFSNTDFCDSWYTSWHPEKGGFSLNEVMEEFEKYPHIKHLMISGGSPTMHPDMLREICKFAHEKYDMHITLETEGSKFIEGCNIDLLSLSPKFTNSIPRVGTKTPLGKEITEREVKKHEKGRRNYFAMAQWIENSKDYQLKPVVADIEKDMPEIDEVRVHLGVPKEKTYLMPAGGTEEDLAPKRAPLMEYCWQKGYNYTDRIHITAYGTKRGV